MKPLFTHDLPLALAGTPLAEQFRYWTGASGRRYLHKILPIDFACDFRQCSLVLASVHADGRREAIWIGAAGPSARPAIAAARAAGATEAHVHLLAETELQAREVANDLRASLETPRESVAA